MIFVYIVWLSVFSFINKILFWLYVIQVKEYRFDRIKDYFYTLQWRKALFNSLFFVEIIAVLIFFLCNCHLLIKYYVLFLILFLEFIYFLFKLFKHKLLIPKFTKRLIILLCLNFFLVFLFLYVVYIYSYIGLIPLVLVLFPLFILFLNFITGFVFDILKQRIFNLAYQKIKSLNIKVVAITWSYWKSSTKEFLYYLLSYNFNVIKTPENINTEIWISNFILNNIENQIKKSSKKSIFIAEAWAYSKWEIAKIWKILNHTDWFITWLWNQHLWLFWSQQNLIDAKFEIWEKILKNKWKLFLSNSNLKLENNNIFIKDSANVLNFKWQIPIICEKLLKNGQIIFYPKFTIKKITQEWTTFLMNWKEFFTNIIWIWQIENLVWAIHYAILNWVKIKDIKETIKSIKLPKHTMNLKIKNKRNWDKTIDILIIDDTYNLSLNWLINWVETIQFFNWEKILVLDDILELWHNSYEVHYKIWYYLANKIDAILFVWINYKKDILKWLNDNWFKWKILNNLNILNEKSIILFEWRKAMKYINLL